MYLPMAHLYILNWTDKAKDVPVAFVLAVKSQHKSQEENHPRVQKSLSKPEFLKGNLNLIIYPYWHFLKNVSPF
jgi:hypothetical protein